MTTVTANVRKVKTAEERAIAMLCPNGFPAAHLDVEDRNDFEFWIDVQRAIEGNGRSATTPLFAEGLRRRREQAAD